MNGSGAQSADCGVVFGTAVRPVYDEQGRITAVTAGPGIARRVRTAVALYEQERLHRIFVTGGKGEGSRDSEAAVMKKLAVSLGVPETRITMEDQSRSTWENELNTRPLTLDCQSILAISDGYHLARIALIAHLQRWNVSTYPAEKKPPVVFTMENWLREAAGIDLLVVLRLLT